MGSDPLNLVLTVLLLLVQLIIAGSVLFRFRLTPAGIVTAGCYAVFAFLLFVSAVVTFAFGWNPWVDWAARVFNFLFTLLLAVGIGLIPMSLKKLAEKA